MHTPLVSLALVYQAGIANVFDVPSFDALRVTSDNPVAVPQISQPEEIIRIFQGDFRSAEMFCRGAAVAGAPVRSFACNRAGDVAHWAWSDQVSDAPFADRMRRVDTVTV